MKILFEEKQKFTQWWLWLIVGVLGLIPIVGLFVQVVLGEDFGNNPMPNTGLVIMLILFVALLVFLYRITLHTTIDEEKIRIRFSILANKTVYWKDVASAEIVNYGFVGYGLRFSAKYSTVYNTSGRMGLRVKLDKGGQFVIGTQRPDELGKVAQQCLLSQGEKA